MRSTSLTDAMFCVESYACLIDKITGGHHTDDDVAVGDGTKSPEDLIDKSPKSDSCISIIASATSGDVIADTDDSFD